MVRKEESKAALATINATNDVRAELIASVSGASAIGQQYMPVVAATGLTPMSLLSALRRRVWLAVGFGSLLAAAAATLIWVFMPPPKPRVSAKMYMTGSVKGTLFEHPDPQISQQSQIALIRSQLVLAAALRSPDISKLDLVRQQEEPLDWLSKELVVDYPNGNEIVRIYLITTLVQDGIKIVDSVKSAYLNEIVNTSTNARKERLDRLQSLQARSQENLKRKQSVVRKLAEAVGSTKPENVAIQQQLIQEQHATAQREFIKIQSDLRRMTIEESALKSGARVPYTPSESAIQDAVDADPAVKELIRRIAITEANLRETERVMAKSFVETATARSKVELSAFGIELISVKKLARDNYLAIQSQRKELDGQTRLVQLRESIAFQKDLSRVLESEVERLGKSIKSINTANLDLEAERIEIASAEDLYSKITGAISTLTAEQDVPPRVRSLENASVERMNLDARKMQLAAVGGFAIFGLVCLIVALFEFRNHRIESPDSVSRLCNLTVLGTVPWVPKNIEKKSLKDQEYWHSVLSESMACTQTFIRHVGNSTSSKLLLVTSAEKAEGKTSLSTQLAQSFARNGVKTLLIDGDIRQPAAHHCFGVQSGPGLCEVLRGEMDSKAVIREVRPNLDFVPAGRFCERAVVALVSGTGSADLRRFKAEYGIIIVDSSPVMLVADGLHLAKQVDGVLVAVLTGRSRENLVREAVARLRQIGAPLLGIMVNGFSYGGYAYGYSYGYNRPSAKPVADDAIILTSVPSDRA